MPDPRIFEQVRYWMFALDPLHVGAGQQKIGRIDLPVLRESGTNLPVIPGTSLSGVTRAYAALSMDRPQCSGKGGAEGQSHCGDCPVCHAFGWAKGSSGSRQGLVQLFTAHLLLFPIATTRGPVWITCPQQLEAAGISSGLPAEMAGVSSGLPAIEDGNFIVLKGNFTQPQLDFGWLYLNKLDGLQDSDLAQWRFPSRHADDRVSELQPIPSVLLNKVQQCVLVGNAMFKRLVDDNLEVRTLVSIKPETGAAEDGALFTYEAIPRSSLLWFDAVYNNPAIFNATIGSNGSRAPMEMTALRDVMNRGISLMQYLGLGGMNTRGLGRVWIQS